MLHFCLYAYYIGILEIFMSFYFWDCFKISFTETEDFVNSARQNPDVFLDHSTLLDIEQDTAMTNHGNVRLTFSVGKDQIEVKRCIKEMNIYITYLFCLLQGAGPCSPRAPILRVWPELVQRVSRGQPRPLRPHVLSAITGRCLYLANSVRSSTLTSPCLTTLSHFLSVSISNLLCKSANLVIN